MAVPEQIYPGNPLGIGRSGAITSPYQFLLDDDTSLRIVTKNSVVGVVVGLSGLRLDEQGLPRTINETHTPNTDRSTKTQDYRIGRGALLRLTLFVTAGTPTIGQTYVIAQLVRGISGQKIVLGTLLAGYITAVQALAFPGSPPQSSIEGPGALRAITGTDPPAFTNSSETVPAGARWALLSFRIGFITDATVGSRYVSFAISRGGTTIMQVPPVTSQTASLSYIYDFLVGFAGSFLATPTEFVNFLPVDTPLLAGDVIGTNFSGPLSSDNLSAPVYQVREWLEVN